jgi:hypothetical protein
MFYVRFKMEKIPEEPKNADREKWHQGLKVSVFTEHPIVQAR